MYESGYNDSKIAHRRQRNRKRRIAQKRKFLLGIFSVVCLFALAGKGMSENQRISAVPPNIPENESVASAESPALSTDNGMAEENAPLSALAEEPPVIAASSPSNVPHTSDTTDDGWKLLLVNPWNPIPSDYQISFTQLKNGHAVDTRCYPDLQAMMDACRAEGLSPVICSSYRTQAKQEQLFNNKVNQYLSKGYSEEEACIEAGKVVAFPGTSEHQLGLALDIVDISNQNLDNSQENTAVQKWLMKHSWEYGFILRYPNNKSEFTGIIYEPWHYRYVGKEAAKDIYEQEICLEEYVMENQ